MKSRRIQLTMNLIERSGISRKNNSNRKCLKILTSTRGNNRKRYSGATDKIEL